MHAAHGEVGVLQDLIAPPPQGLHLPPHRKQGLLLTFTGSFQLVAFVLLSLKNILAWLSRAPSMCDGMPRGSEKVVLRPRSSTPASPIQKDNLAGRRKSSFCWHGTGSTRDPSLSQLFAPNAPA
eukprot:CAMPEP_0177410584 /NCGR_PEP_ID=MMETSP0368-20130122/64921_1 /TAXON_ID=447022 ORGANISM="Scrippsiella hangoei-like, Strain SHHI-4" /NCGR_SAMPLE_ID=MMETSP0368 /ASSEMBLY_ACC=CAM_ASM_000363 /LENGTH=123 /DNA_ID=CAMNT_0018879561 /DNA_START=131 /DNA_END=503 /DNA_ORIENTATION=-